MRRRRPLLIISPHPDDAALSLGGSILKYPRLQTTIWNVFTRQSYSLVDRDAERAQQRIVEEERAAAAALGVGIIMAEFREAELRGYVRLSERLGHDYQSIYIRPGERELREAVTTALQRVVEELQPALVGMPLGIGGHVDHLLCREAALACLARSGWQGRLFCYEELPYALRADWRIEALAMAERRGLVLSEGLIPVGPWLDTKHHILEIYRSQLHPRDIRQLVTYSASLCGLGGGERIWCLARQRRQSGIDDDAERV